MLLSNPGKKSYSVFGWGWCFLGEKGLRLLKFVSSRSIFKHLDSICWLLRSSLEEMRRTSMGSRKQECCP